MAWFHKSLNDMKVAIEREDWDEVKRILQQHNRSMEEHVPRVQHDISDISHRISQYGADITQISAMLAARRNGQNTKDLMLTKVTSAIEQAHFFEETIIQLIKERKFME